MTDLPPTRESATWTDGTPFSDRFRDRYFDSAGPDESSHVFLTHNGLPGRWRSAAHFTVGELGFGTGLNACLTFDTWMRHAPPDATLDYISIEAFPLPPSDMRQTVTAWPALAPWMEPLADACEQLTPGFNLRVLAGGRIRLLLLVGDVEAMLQSLDARVDAWFLDGFAPARNPGMWSEPVCRLLADHTGSDGSFATYTAAGWVRRNLQAAGFVVDKAPGFGRKREMLRGRLACDSRPAHGPHPAWFRRPPATQSTHVDVIGAGLAGAATARALAERGLHVTVHDDPTPARAAPSRLPGLIVRPYPERATNLRGRFYDRAFAHAAHRLRGAAGWHPGGVAVLNHRGGPNDAMLGAEALSALAGRPLATGGRWLPEAGWLDPSAWAKAWLDHPAIESVPGRPKSANPDRPTVHATGASPTPWDAQHPVSVSRGQLSAIAVADVGADRPALAGGGLCIPQEHGFWLGASHVRGCDDTAPDAEEAEKYLAEWAERLMTEFDTGSAVHMAAVRAGTADRMPQVGPVPDAGWWEEHYADVRHGRPQQVFPAPRHEPNQWLHRGHGSRGATAALLCGEVIAAAITGAPLPVDRDTWAGIHPGRLLIQQLRRGEQTRSGN